MTLSLVGPACYARFTQHRAQLYVALFVSGHTGRRSQSNLSTATTAAAASSTTASSTGVQRDAIVAGFAGFHVFGRNIVHRRATLSPPGAAIFGCSGSLTIEEISIGRASCRERV